VQKNLSTLPGIEPLLFSRYSFATPALNKMGNKVTKRSGYSDWLWAGWTRGSRHGKDELFLLSTPYSPILGPIQPPIQRISGALSLGVKRPVLEADHSPLIIAEVKNTCIYTSTPQYAFMA
jgi:hypothetical protein